MLALAGLSGCVGGEFLPAGGDAGGGDGERDYTSWLYDPGQFLEPELTMFTSIDVGRTTELFEASVEDELPELQDEFDEFTGVEALERVTGLAFGAQDSADEAIGMSVAMTGTFDVDALVEELEHEQLGEDELIGPAEYDGYEVYMIEDGGELSGMAMSDDAVVFGFFDGVDANSTEPVTVMIDEYESASSGYSDGREDGAYLLDRLEGELSVTGIEFDAAALGLEEAQDPMAQELFEGLSAVGSASDVTGEGTVSVDAVLVYETEADADAEAIESAIDALVMSEPALEDELEGLELTDDGRTVELALTFDPDDVDVDDPFDDPSMLLFVGVFPALAVGSAFVLDLGSTASPEAQLAVDIDERADAEEVTVTVTSVANAADAYLRTDTTVIHDFEVVVGSSYTLSVEDGEYAPGDTIMVIGVTEDGTETVVATHETSA